MTEPTTISTPLSEAPDGTPPATASPPARPPKRWDWKPKLRWFAAEIVVVVAGILIALTLNAWWGARQDAAKEQNYLRQLVADLQETERLVAEANANIAPWDRASARLLQSFRMPQRPPEDSVYTWLGQAIRVNRVRPVVGTADALVATGDLNLLRNGSLRTAITAYLDRNQHLVTAVDLQLNEFIDATERLGDRVDLLEAVPVSEPEGAADIFAEAYPYSYFPEGPRRTPFPVDLEALFRDRDAYVAIQLMARTKRLMATNRLSMLQRARTLREQVEAELNQ